MIRSFVSCILAMIGVIFLTIGTTMPKQLWHGVMVKTEYKDREKIVYKDYVYSGDHAELADRAKAYIGDNIVKHTGPVTVTSRWFFAVQGCDKEDKTGWHCSSTGQYQLLTNDNRVLVLQFCSPTPDIKKESKIDITYLLSKSTIANCEVFVEAKILEEPK